MKPPLLSNAAPAASAVLANVSETFMVCCSYGEERGDQSTIVGAVPPNAAAPFPAAVLIAG